MTIKRNWSGLLRILEISHIDKHGKLLWKSENLYNILHQGGEEFLLMAAFTGGQNSTIIPDFYYLGLDNRPSIAADDTIDDLIGEPDGDGYVRQPISSSGDFTLSLDQDHFIATSPIVAFRATTNSWGPVNNLFLTDLNDNSGTLISSVQLPSLVSLDPGDAVTMRIGLQIFDC